ncbi:hypothetical protein J2W28_000068 [Variovorax boronicumulans]|uniref:Immunity protein Imm33 domain-containing protein n=1 Tax=Variovorax paradoxus (strain EPS) TaxID=595537 RepID=E6V483_VARPE|nr:MULTISPECIES: DUF2185 domain-containing protein [Variovorax]ADU39277.1 Protein of unknown function DUF2185 [Variovorax paradoxus EPS]MDP9990549.1 hypothetical protein [Variovorax boronicumulans]MDQ0000940.1 hypothetical protein [Variovorax boronicumulans]MDQ0606159.1 hypothetical protein [Variovorax sp. W1I1]
MWPFKKKKEPWEEKFAALGPMVLASDQVMGPNRLPVGFAYRVKPNNPYDTGWIFQSGKESQSVLDDNPPKICPLNSFLKMDPTLSEITDKPVGSAWERDSGDAPWKEVFGFKQRR